MADQPGFEEKAISDFVKNTLSGQLDGFMKLAVAVRTDFMKLLQGEVDSVSFKAENLVREDIQVQELEVQTDHISINPLSAILGKIRLDEPLDSTIRMVLSEADLNRDMNSDIAISQLKPIDLNVEGQVIPIEFQPPFRVRLSRDNKIRFTGIMKVHEPGNTRQVAFTTVASPRTDTQPILLETFCCAPNQGSSIPFMIAFLNKLQDIVSQPYFELDTVAVRVVSLAIENKLLTAQVEIHARQIPSM